MTCIDVRRSAGRATPQWRLMTSCWRLEAQPSATKRHQAPPGVRFEQSRIESRVVAKPWRSLLVLVTAVAGMSCAGGGSVPGSTTQGNAMLDAADLHMIDGQNGWAFGPHRLARTSDGADTLLDATPPDMSGANQLDQPVVLHSNDVLGIDLELTQSTLEAATLGMASEG